MQGRICLFSVHDGRLFLISEVETNGAVYNITGFQKQLLAGINSRIQLYRYVRIGVEGYGQTTELKGLLLIALLQVEEEQFYIKPHMWALRPHDCTLCRC